MVWPCQKDWNGVWKELYQNIEKLIIRVGDDSSNESDTESED